ncbi:allantoinase, mitochondrial-like [Terrapene carolina triunguis]|uniref:allantoinase, mitochondrial-like n=1 Tax=Terrapene triunguis TaxID=2587831 RepID=UPI000E77D67F|nr:allantoinase, mitochondrial-like [Terrapene carolina triunguis]
MSTKHREASQTGATKVEVGSEVMAVRSNRVVLDNTICPAEIIICNGKIADILPKRSWVCASGEKVLDVGDLVVMPGIIDPHVHTCEPGHTAWEGYSSATKAAAAGGVTTLVAMPLSCLPPTTTLENFDDKLQSAEGQCYVDVAFWGGVIPGNQDELLSMLQAGVPGFKCSLIASGVEEFPHVSLQDLHMAMNELQGTDCVLLFHAEQELGQWKPALEDPTEYRALLDSRPDAMEVEAVQTIANLCLQYKVPCHILHLSSAQALPIIREARQKGAPLTVETAHHYLTLTSERIPPGGTYYKCCPPIRAKTNQEQLWSALQEGLIDMVVSAHNPGSPDLKILDDGDFFKAQGGIASLQFGLPLFWTSAKSKGFSLHDMVQLMCKNPASLSRLDDHKGALCTGMDADLVIWDPDKEFEVKKNMIQHKNQLTPYLGFQLRGEVLATLVHGRLVYLKGKFSPKPEGVLLVTQRKMSTRVSSSPYY